MIQFSKQLITRWLAAVICCSGLSSAQAVVETSTYVTAINVFTNAVGNQWARFSLEPEGEVEVVPFAPDVVRVRFHFEVLFPREEIAIDKTFENWPSFNQSFSQPSATNYLIETDQLTISITLSNRFQIHFYNTNGVLLSEDVAMEYDMAYKPIEDTNAYAEVDWPGESHSVSNLPSGYKFKAVKKMADDEVFFGLGDSGGPLKRNGRAYQFWGQDTYQFGEYRNPKYTALPMVYSVRGPTMIRPSTAFGLFFNNPVRPVFKMYGTNNTWSFEAGDDQLDYFFFSGGSDHTMPRIINRFSELTGRPVMLPKWAMGYHQSRHSYFTQDRVMEVATDMRTNGFPCDAIYLDIGAQQWTNSQPTQLTFNSDYSDTASLVTNVGALGMKLVPLIEPLLATNDPLFAVAESNLYFIKQNNLETYVGTNFLGRIAWLDFSNDFAVDWWAGLITNYLSTYGFEAIWNDLNEPNENYMPVDALWYLNGVYGDFTTNDTRKWHSNNKNTYSIYESRMSYDALKLQNPEKRPFVLSRGAWPGVQKYAAGWGGDNKSEFDHLRFNQTFGLSVMLSGQAWFGHDVGGFVGPTNSINEQLFIRWMQSSVLQPFYRNHIALDRMDREPYVFGTTVTSWNRHWVKFRYQIMPYLYSLAAASTTSGVPINAPTVFYFQSDTNTYTDNDNEYMVGKDLLVAPVYISNDFHRTVYLPGSNSWYYWNKNEKYEGGQTVTVSAYLGMLPLFSRAGGIVVCGPVQYYANEFLPDYLDILHWPGGTNSFLLYEDDGESTNYLTGVYAKTVMQSSSATNFLNFTIRPREGTYGVGARDYYLSVYDVDAVDAIWVNSSIVERVANRYEAEEASGSAWSYAVHERELVVKIPDTGLHTVIEAGFASWEDSDGDGLPDDWEEIFYGGVTNADSAADTDGDFLDNIEEYAGGTHPLRTDAFSSIFSNMAVAGTLNLWNEQSDNMRLMTNNVWAYVADLSGQTNVEFKFVANNNWGQGNWGEQEQSEFLPPLENHSGSVSGSNIKLNGPYTGFFTFLYNETNSVFSVLPGAQSDIDGDGITDDWEAYYGYNPYSSADAVFDTDGDYFNELQEYIGGSSPVDGDQQVQIANILSTLAPASVVEWLAASGRQYRVLYSTNLFQPSGWLTLEPFTNVLGDGTVMITDTSPVPYKVYRIDVSKP